MEVGVIVKKVMFVGLATAAAASAALFGAGTATAAPDVVGMKYSDALQEIKDSGGRAVVASRVGDKLDQGDCIVTNVWNSSFLRIDEQDNNEMSVALNCAGEYATATSPGASVANPLGRAAKAEDEEAAARKRAQQQAAQAELQALEEVSTPDQ
ncbi:PASTA domain-containing protein [Mycolicibacterium flavescens]|uniref:PASTA domain-containing protein n=1 Tax=Mycolicibacterium flavescens TaxID=1776 RepID=A0A1E3RJI0_MYCFV|nr:PASTA domain-containing protein [Mycolicibacterium flavescens]MCV7280601.1 PASTA domain-containing protein [Mycolicibacterium flavescens]ODQ90018.1 hypothetical protein BHQ18_11210 [Mycolicibacterium flavescens]